uniref:HMA domain-containing protein n=1 Tax=Strongyloides venezuelensis TaxID=75913 RepID=A0A0K0EUG1_STRVS
MVNKLCVNCADSKIVSNKIPLTDVQIKSTRRKAVITVDGVKENKQADVLIKMPIIKINTTLNNKKRNGNMLNILKNSLK